MGHLWVFSPPFFILVWDVKRIAQSSVKNFSLIGASFVLASSVLFQSYGWTERKFHEFTEEEKNKWCKPAFHNESESSRAAKSDF